MGPTTRCYGLSGAVEVACLYVERTPSGELLYKSYRFLSLTPTELMKIPFAHVGPRCQNHLQSLAPAKDEFEPRM
jgi:hypothetical protein